ncbi:MAG: OmpA family protein [Bacteroidota bacterium]|jgi:outer membrane protein OmpA-like peptidoglycan-associated protein|nr:OmpA family protein [Bacteroidota bacterium]
MKKVRSFGLLFLVILVQASFAQIKRANKYYDNYNYKKAIELYKRVLNRDDNTEALEKIANSYRLTKDYKQAEIYYSRLVQKENINPINHFYYGSVLKNNNKIDQAREEFKKYSALAPDDKKVETQFKSLEDIKIWVANTQQYEIGVLPINTPHAEFCPVFYKNQIAYASSKIKDLVNESQDNWDEQPYLNVLTTPFKTDDKGKVQFSKNVSSFPWPINTELHDGPVCFNAEQNLAFVTRVNSINKKDKAFVNRPQLYIYALKGNKWVPAKPFPFNDLSYSILHPSLSADGQNLYFASDMPGGNGGADIYVCKKEGDSWAKPQNLGPEINTSGNEVFPYIRKDGHLYFSSDAHSGFGGLDVFSAVLKDGIYSDIKNMGYPFNSSTDDFGVLFNDEYKSGYLSSDRPGGKGSDDIYSFIVLNKFVAVTGKILLSKDLNDPAKNVEVNLLTQDGTILKVTTTDSTGFFKFENLDPDNNYMVKLNEDDPNLKKNTKYYMADQSGKIVRVTVINDKGGKFVFTNLPYDPNALSQVSLEEVNLAGNLLYGENPSKPLPNTKVNLVNDKGEIIQTVTTNELGAFVFTNLPPDVNYFVKIDETDTQLSPNTKVIVTNIAGKEILTTKTDNKGGFKFEFLATDVHTMEMLQVEDQDLRFDFNAFLVNDKKDPLANTIINLVDSEGNVIKSIKTDASGGFLFTNLPAEKNLLFSVDESDPKLKDLSLLYLVDGNGKVIKEISKSKGVFRFTVLPSEEKLLGKVYVEDPELALERKYNEGSIHFEWKAFLVDSNKNPLPDAGISLIDENNTIIQNIRTDGKGSFIFKDLPGHKKMMFMVDGSDSRIKDLTILYIIDEKGNVLKEIVKSGGSFIFTVLPSEDKKLGIIYEEDTRLAGKDLKVVNKDLRFEWKAFVTNDNKVHLPNIAINFVNANGDVIQSIRTDDKGSFVFSNLPTDENLMFSINGDDAAVKDLKIIYIIDENGKVIKEVIKTGGKFIFTILPSEEKSLGRIYIEDPWLAVTKLRKDNASGVITNAENLYYDYGKADLLPEAKKILDKIIFIMKEDAQLHVVLESHTDSRSSYGFNIKLSRLRAKTAVDYMIASGIPKDRIKGKGFGEMKPVNKCKEGVACSEEEFAKNRRTEFKIIRKKK